MNAMIKHLKLNYNCVHTKRNLIMMCFKIVKTKNMQQFMRKKIFKCRVSISSLKGLNVNCVYI